MKSFKKIIPPYFMEEVEGGEGGGSQYALAPLENYVGLYAPSIFARKCRLKIVNILNLAKTIL